MTNQENRVSETISRRAIDPTGSPGSFYDIRRDSVLEEQTTNDEVTKKQLLELVRCEIIDGDTEKSRNVLQMIGIDGDLRLNILLRPKLRTGVAALVDHCRPTDKFTRFLYIFYCDRELSLSDDSIKAKIRAKSSSNDDKATHIITALSYGFDVVVVLQLPCKDIIVTKIDVLLNKIRTKLENSNSLTDFTTDDASVLEKITETKVYSNVTELTEMTSLLAICQYIRELGKKKDRYCPVNYTLRSTEWLYPGVVESNVSYNPIDKKYSDKLEEYLMEILEQIKKIRYKLGRLESKQLVDQLKGSLLKVREEWQHIQERYENVIDGLKKLVLGIQRGKNNTSEIDEVLQHNDQATLKESVRKLMKQVTDLEGKTDPSNDAQHALLDKLEPPNAKAYRNDNGQKLNDDLPSEKRQAETASPGGLLIETHQTASPTEQKEEYEKTKQNTNSSPLETQSSDMKSSITTDETINILLLGESGVGKSTFINAFVNYLKFETLKQAESSAPAVIIPVSFLITTGNNFEEHTIKFGDSDSLNNEDFDHPGQSVTQQCKSYLFDIDRQKGLKFRIIDTPGFGDTRGIDQDDRNMQHILEYVNHFDHVNAVCFLLKPNTSQINTFFRTCLTQLLDLLGTDIRQNIIFCFTSARSTFYMPGDTAPLLKNVLKSLSIPNIPFKKSNTFCFDNESFRYLVALQNAIKFDDQDREEYEMSWTKSVDESKRLRNYIHGTLYACYIKDEQQSIKRAEIQITSMVRSILESMRNILRNMIICDVDSPHKSIELKPKSLSRPATLCLKCEREHIQKGQFWIVSDVPHEIQKECYNCECASSQHVPIGYQLQCEYLDKPSRYSLGQMKDNFSLLRNASTEFAYFLRTIAHSSKDDSFLIGIIQMIDEENDIRKRQKPNEMNLQLAERLRELLRTYEKRIENRNLTSQQTKLSVIYEWIQTICEYPEVDIQMKAVKKTQEGIMKLHEYQVSEDLANTSVR